MSHRLSHVTKLNLTPPVRNIIESLIVAGITLDSCPTNANLLFKQDTIESIIVGIDCESHVASIGLVLPVWADATVTLDGDGGFSIGSAARVNIFKPVSIQV